MIIPYVFPFECYETRIRVILDNAVSGYVQELPSMQEIPKNIIFCTVKEPKQKLYNLVLRFAQYGNNKNTTHNSTIYISSR